MTYMSKELDRIWTDAPLKLDLKQLEGSKVQTEKVLHLLQNAVEASAEDEPVMLQARREGNEVAIEVIDTGAGMTPEFVRTTLFKPFHSSKPGGFGIGAYEAREMIRAMGGRLEVESHEGLGTRFVVHLPLAEAAELIRNMQKRKAKVA